jgi:hypothetical protein
MVKMKSAYIYILHSKFFMVKLGLIKPPSHNNSKSFKRKKVKKVGTHHMYLEIILGCDQFKISSLSKYIVFTIEYLTLE